MKKVSLTNSSEPAMVGDGDFRKVSRRRWGLGKNGYVRSTDHPRIYLHRLIIGKPPKGLLTDHQDGNRLNNRRRNLRFVTYSQSNMNRKRGRLSDTTSSFKGVCWDSERKRWIAQIRRMGGKRKFLGRFTSSINAAKAYDEAAKKLHGKFAKLNFPMRFPRYPSRARSAEVRRKVSTCCELPRSVYSIESARYAR